MIGQKRREIGRFYARGVKVDVNVSGIRTGRRPNRKNTRFSKQKELFSEVTEHDQTRRQIDFKSANMQIGLISSQLRPSCFYTRRKSRLEAT